jgi:hypothetical protein
MEQFQGTITKEGQIVAGDVEIHLQIVQKGRLREVRAYIVTGLGWQTFRVNERYQLTALDGRKGDFFFGGVVPFGDGSPRRIELTFYEGFE